MCVDATGMFMYVLIRDPSTRRLLTFVWEMELPDVDKFWKLMVKRQLSRFFGITFADLVVRYVQMCSISLSTVIFSPSQVFEGTSGIDNKYTTVQFTGEVHTTQQLIFVSRLHSLNPNMQILSIGP